MRESKTAWVGNVKHAVTSKQRLVHRGNEKADVKTERSQTRRNHFTISIWSTAKSLRYVLTAEERQQFVHETCRVLRRVKFLLLIEYTAVMVPIVYVYHLPNRKYFPYLNEMSKTDLNNTIRNVWIYGTLQLLSFILLLVALNRRFRLAPGTILRFDLGNEWRVVQGQFVLWIIYVLQSSIQHVGTCLLVKYCRG
ncbi:hypothetical protein JG687_00007973 [Phytophthora cactorum]|uniref:Uncharacterized protein n=1 Tax=Phytophthora cactorum TaxID=29920 RepID=A0A8T1UE01_9STRA|nr:hypothetical protein JG687_00007973 [Phytophthora cactorum]